MAQNQSKRKIIHSFLIGTKGKCVFVCVCVDFPKELHSFTISIMQSIKIVKGITLPVCSKKFKSVNYAVYNTIYAPPLVSIFFYFLFIFNQASLLGVNVAKSVVFILCYDNSVKIQFEVNEYMNNSKQRVTKHFYYKIILESCYTGVGSWYISFILIIYAIPFGEIIKY